MVEVPVVKQEGLNFQLRQAREEARAAAISLGGDLAPGVLLVDRRW